MAVEYTKPKLLLVEGEDDKSFCSGLLGILGIRDNFQVDPYSGKDKLANHLRAVVSAASFKENVLALGVMRDADNDQQAARQSVMTALYNAALTRSPNDVTPKAGRLRIAIHIVADSSGRGRLEEMILEAVAQDKRMPCIKEYFQCLTKAVPEAEFPKDQGKAKVDIFLASQQRPSETHQFDHDGAARLETAAQRRYLNLDHPVYDALKQFLLTL